MGRSRSGDGLTYDRGYEKAVSRGYERGIGNLQSAEAISAASEFLSGGGGSSPSQSQSTEEGGTGGYQTTGGQPGM